MARADQRLLVAFLFFFLTNLFLTSALSDPRDVATLQALYGSLGAPPQLTGWRSDGGDPCGGEPWRGVSCSGQSVVSIKINGMGIGGILGWQLSAFMSLKELDVSYNNISGEIPFALPPNATRIDLAVNYFTGSIPYSLPSLKSLNHLNVSHNSLSGSIGNVFTDIQSLEHMDLSFNHFSGDLPSSFSSLTNLHELYLQDNQFTGSVNFLANLPLSVLCLENNRFSGSVPKQFEFIPQLRINGNLFQPGYMFSPPPMDRTTHSPLTSADRNISTHSPLTSADRNISHTPDLSSFGYSSVQVGNRSHKDSHMGAMIGTVSGVFFVALLAAGAAIVHFHRYHKSNLDRSKSTEDSMHTLPISLPTVTTMNLDQCPWRSPPMTSLRPLSVRHIKPERISKRKSSSTRSRYLLTAKLYSASDILAATSNYSEENLVGEGSIGCVYRAEFPDGQIFAVKNISLVALAIYEEEEFLDVILNMSRLRHPNIATIVGYCVEGQHTIVYEYASNGSLDDFLFPGTGTQKILPWNARVRIALGVAHALEYMHKTCSPPISHGNIKATNILLDDELIPQICDCGLTELRHLVSTKPKTSELASGSSGYNAPEHGIAGKDKFKCDVYSFGVVLLELLTGRRAFDSSRKKEEQSLVTWASFRLHDFCLLEEMVDPTITGTIPSRALSRFADIILPCLQPAPEFRCQINEITDSLLQISQRNGQGPKLSTVEASDLTVSDLSFKSTIAYLEQSSSDDR